MNRSGILVEQDDNEYCSPAKDSHFVAKEWMTRNGSRLHRGFASGSSYEEQRAHIVQKLPAREYDVVGAHTDNFNNALFIYRSTSKERFQDLDVRDVHSWDDLSRVYQEAQRKYAEKSKGWLGLPRRLGRSTGDNAASVVYPWLSLIPDDTYGSTVKSALALIFGVQGSNSYQFDLLYLRMQAAIRLSERRKLILETFGNIPFLVRDTEYSFEDFSNDPELRRLITELYISILQTVMAMMEWLVERAGWKQIKALLQGPEYGKSLDDMVKSTQDQLGAIDKRVNRLTRGTIVSTFATVSTTASQINTIQGDTRKLTSVTRDVKNDTGAIKGYTETMQAEITDIGNSVHGMRDTHEKAFHHITNLLVGQEQNSIWMQRAWQEARRREEVERSQKEVEMRLQAAESKLRVASVQLEHRHQQHGMIVRSDDLLRYLSVDPRRIVLDVKDTIRGGQLLDYAVHGRSHMLTQDPKFQDWLSSANSACLLVDGNSGSAMERISAMSVVCALLAENLPNEVASTISYFCGIRAGEDEMAKSSVNLVRDLLAQIIYTYRLDTTFLEIGAFSEFQHFNLRRLCSLFIEMVKKLPYGAVVFCIIDGITWIEEDECLEDTCYVLQVLSNLTHDPGVRSIFKLLITSPLASHYARELIPIEEQLSLLREVTESDGTPFTSKHLGLQSVDGREELCEETMGVADFDEGFADEDFDEGVILEND